MSEPIGVAQVVHSLEVGGMERVAVQLAAGLPRHRYRPLIICLTIRGDYADWAQREGVEVLALGKREGKAPFLFRRLARFLKEKGVSLVHAHNSGPWFTGTLAALAGRIGPVVVTDHSRPYADRFRVRAIEWALSHAVTVVSVSEENRTRLSKHLWIPPERIRVIPNGVAPIADAPPDRLRALRDEFRIDDRSFVFLCVARYEAQKSLDVLFQAAHLLAERGLDARILLVGKGSLEEDLRRRAADTALKGLVTVTGKRLDVGLFYRAANALVLSSRWEGLPMSVLEGMSAGLPVISTQVGDIPTAVEHHRNGQLVPPGDAAALAEAMAGMAADPLKARAMGREGEAVYRERFSVERMVERYTALYEEVL